MRAEVTFEEGRMNNQETEAQAIPLLNNILVHIILGLNRKKILESQKQYTIKLFNVLREANKVLLFRQIKYIGEKLSISSKTQIKIIKDLQQLHSKTEKI